MEVIFRKSAEKSIAKLILYIEEGLQMPATAQSFSDRIQHFVFDELPAQVKVH